MKMCRSTYDFRYRFVDRRVDPRKSQDVLIVVINALPRDCRYHEYEIKNVVSVNQELIRTIFAGAKNISHLLSSFILVHLFLKNHQYHT